MAAKVRGDKEVSGGGESLNSVFTGLLIDAADGVTRTMSSTR